MIFDMRRRGLSISAIARKTGLCRKTIRQHLKRGLENPVYGPRLLDPYEGYLRERVESCPGLSGKRLFREIRELGYEGGYTAVTDCLREILPCCRVPLSGVSKPGRADRHKWTLPSSRSGSATNPGGAVRSGCSHWYWATAAGYGDVSVRTRSWKRYCVVTSWPLKPAAAPRPRCCTTA